VDAKTWRGGTYGVRVGKQNARQYFDQSWASIQVKIGGEFHTFSLSKTFWTTCPEFRGGPLPKWFAHNGLTDWPEGRSYRLSLRPLGGNRFELIDPRV
jgi:hypothetical protein